MYKQMCACPTLDKNCHRLKTSRIYFYLQIFYVMQKLHQCNVCFCCHGNRRLALTDHIRYSVTDSGTCTLSACNTDVTALIHTHCVFCMFLEQRLRGSWKQYSFILPVRWEHTGKNMENVPCKCVCVSWRLWQGQGRLHEFWVEEKEHTQLKLLSFIITMLLFLKLFLMLNISE